MTKKFDLHFISTNFGVETKTVHHLNATNFDDAMAEAYIIINFGKGYNYELYRNNEFFIDFIL